VNLERLAWASEMNFGERAPARKLNAKAKIYEHRRIIMV